MYFRTALTAVCSVCLVLLSLPAVAQIPADLEANSILGTVSINFPLAVRHAGDGSGRLFIAERGGTIKVFKPGSDMGTGTDLLTTPFLNITDVDTFFEGGLLGLAFHPNYAANGYFYVSYTRDGTGRDSLETVIARYEVSAGDPDVADGTSGIDIFTLGQPAGNHNGGDLHFSPTDGFLYLSLGDGGGGSGPGNGQNTSTLLGNILRIDPCDTATCTTGYTIPADNPFVGVAGEDEIWSYGHRNPYRFSFDRLNGDMFMGDVGSSGGQRTEEVNFHADGDNSGPNFGWSCEEGVFGDCMATPPAVRSIMSHVGSQGDRAITGGYRYRGCIQGLQGMYLWGDSTSGQIRFGTENTPGNWSYVEPAAWNLSSTLGFGEDEDGELYVLFFSDVVRFESASDCVAGGLFEDGFESGDTTAWSSTSP